MLDSSMVQFTTSTSHKTYVENIPSNSAYSLHSTDSLAVNQLDGTGNGHASGTKII